MTRSRWRRLWRRLWPRQRRRPHKGRPAAGSRGQVEPETQRHDFLTGLHERLRPRTYLEIGVNDGRSLARSHVPSIAVDPAFRVSVEIRADVHLARATSDDFFARPDPLMHFKGRGLPPLAADPDAAPAIDLAFIDGLHLFEFALRDFINIERFAAPTSVIVLDDMLPRSATEAARDRVSRAWAGDVYKLISILRQYRPELIVIPVDSRPTGLVVVLAPDMASTVLRDAYEEIVGANMAADPQPVPQSILRREGALSPDALLASGVWDIIAHARARGAPRDEVVTLLRGELDALIAEGAATG
jgi:predicted O-methyltransferase YrrM